MRILITGSAGFIGFHLTKLLLRDGHDVTGMDNINDYYDVNLKYTRLAETGIPKEKIVDGIAVQSETEPGYRFVKLALEDRKGMTALFEKEGFDVPKTWADVSDLFDYIDYKPQGSYKEGIAEFIQWYRSYYLSR